MEKIRKKILITNDDGIDSPGMRRLAAWLGVRDDTEVYIAAPATEQSAKSQSLTFHTPILPEEREVPGAYKAYAFNGTPADCIMWAVPEFARRGIEFDYLFSGINLGDNTGIAAYYSGTISAAREGAIRGIKSVALSLSSHQATHFDYICNLIPRIMEMSDSAGPSVIISVNAPDIPAWEVKGVRVIEAAPWGYREIFGFRETEPDHFKLARITLPDKGRWVPADKLNEKNLKYDIDCVKNGFVAISPLTSAASDRIALRKLQGLWPQDDSLVLIMDVQEKLISGITGEERFRENISKFARCAVRLDLPLAVAELYGMGGTIASVCNAAGSMGRAETVLRKEFSAWDSMAFANMLERSSVRRIMIAGLETHTSVMQTAVDLAAAGYDVSVVEDCCASREGHDHKVAIERMRDAGCKILTCRAAVMDLMHQTSHPAADAIRNILG